MKTTERIFGIRAVRDEGAPQIDIGSDDHRKIPWKLIGDIIDGDRDIAMYRPIELVVDHPEALSWDLYAAPGTLGLLSQRARDLLGAYALRYYELLEAKVNKTPYFFLRPSYKLGCLDREHSVTVPYPDEPGSIMNVNVFAFNKAKIEGPVIFSIPDFGGMYATESVVRLIYKHFLNGFTATWVA